jgi:exonuclease III
MMDSGNILIWNVRGFNSRARRDVVRELVTVKRPSIICFQETKLNVISEFSILQILVTGFEYSYIPADQT